MIELTANDRRLFAAAAKRFGRVQFSKHQLAIIGVTRRRLTQLVQAGHVQEGVLGYYLTQPVDPGFTTVAQRAMRRPK